MRDRIANTALIALTFSSLTLTTLAIKNQFFSRRAPTTTSEIVVDSHWRTYRNGGIATGPANAPVTVAIFSDFQCPFCRKLDPAIERVRQEYPSNVRVVFHHYPLEGIHPYAKRAAVAAQCMSTKGSFSKMESALFANQDRIGTVDWSWFAKLAGVGDSAWLARCMDDQHTIDQVDGDVKMGNDIPISGTPTVFINSKRLPGTPTYEVIKNVISQELSATAIQ